MRMLVIVSLIVVLSSTSVGCRSIRPSYSLFESDREHDYDRLWREGYGYNNPNSERIKRGLNPVNLNGREHKSGGRDFGEELLGDLLTFTVFKMIPAAWDGLTSRLRR